MIFMNDRRKGDLLELPQREAPGRGSNMYMTSTRQVRVR